MLAADLSSGFSRKIFVSKFDTEYLFESSYKFSSEPAAFVPRFFDFLRKPDGDMDMESGVVPYIEEAQFNFVSHCKRIPATEPGLCKCRMGGGHNHLNL